MLFIVSVLIAAVLSYLLRGTLKKHPAPFYVAAAVITALVSVIDFSGASPFVGNYVIGLFSRGALAAGFWVVIMWLGALPNGSAPVKALMPVRGELSVFAAILTLGHNIGFGRTYFVRMFTSPSSMEPSQLAAGIISIIMILIMLPLTVMSFKKVRKKMKAKTWKRIQRLAYVFYGLMYVHVMILLSSQARAGRISALISVLMYSVVFIGYAGVRIAKALSKKKPEKRRGYTVTGGSMALAVTIAVLAVMSPIGNTTLTPTAPENTGTLADTGDTATEETDDGSTPLYVDGSYTGTAYGYDGDITVIVKIVGGRITSIEATSEESDQWYFGQAEEKVIDRIIDTQSDSVDVVSGATYSSRGIMNAVKDALSNAK